MPPGRLCSTLLDMHPIVLLEPLSMLRHAPDQGFRDSPTALTQELTPPDADVLQLHQALQQLAQAQHAQERAYVLAKLRQRLF